MRETSLTYLLNVRMIDCLLNNRNSATFDRLFVAKSKASHIRPGDCDSFLFHGGDLFHEPVAGVRIAKKDPPRYNIARDLTAPFPIPN